MKVILLKDDKKLGKKNSVVDVKDGYGVYLIRQNLAIQATRTSLDKLARHQEEDRLFDAQMTSKALRDKEVLEKDLFMLDKSYNKDTSRLNGSITKEDLVKIIALKYPDIKLKTSSIIEFPKTKSIQLYEAKIKLYRDIIASVKFGVNHD